MWKVGDGEDVLKKLVAKLEHYCAGTISLDVGLIGGLEAFPPATLSVPVSGGENGPLCTCVH